MDSLLSRRQLILETVSECLQCTCDYRGKVVITKRNRDLVRGDFEIRAPNLGKTWPSGTTLAVGKNLLECKEKYIDRVHVNGDLLMVHLNRAEACKDILTRVIKEKEKYGTNDSNGEQCCILSYPCASNDVNMDHLRSLLLAEHTSYLLHANGYVTNIIHTDTQMNVSLQDTFQMLKISRNMPISENDPLVMNKNFIALSKCKWRQYDENESVQETVDACEGNGDDTKTDIILNLKQFTVDQNLVFEKNGYDKNIHLVKITRNDLRFRQAVDIVQTSEQLQISRIVHINGHKKDVHGQQVDLLSRIISSGAANHAHVVHRGVDVLSADKTVSVSVKDYYRYRSEDMHRSFSVKYGGSVQGTECQEIIDHVTQAAIAFDFLTTNASSPVKLDMISKTSIDREQSHTGGGVFVMYNCARLAMLLSKFQKQVCEGTYASLPAVDEIDFTNLKEQEEWTLLFNYIATFPSVIRETMAAMETKVPRPHIQTHKVCHFLLDLVRDFSSYYSRTHVLTEARPHLLPVMYARLTLLTALQHVIHNSLRLLNIEPLSHM